MYSMYIEFLRMIKEETVIPVWRVVSDLEVTKNTVYKWIDLAAVDGVTIDTTTDEEDEECVRLADNSYSVWEETIEQIITDG